MNIILPANYKDKDATPTKLQSSSLSLDAAIQRFLSEWASEKFDSFCAIWIDKYDNEVRVFWGTYFNLGSQKSYESLHYLAECLKLSYGVQIESEPLLKQLPPIEGTEVPPSASIGDLIDLLRKERKSVKAFAAAFCRGTEYKFTHGIEESVKPNTEDYLEIAANLCYGTVTGLKNIQRLFKKFNDNNKRLIQVVNPDHRELLGIPGRYVE